MKTRGEEGRKSIKEDVDRERVTNQTQTMLQNAVPSFSPPVSGRVQHGATEDLIS
jgi:hypothetical protein